MPLVLHKCGGNNQWATKIIAAYAGYRYRVSKIPGNWAAFIFSWPWVGESATLRRIPQLIVDLVERSDLFKKDDANTYKQGARLPVKLSPRLRGVT
jgi:hypothetical protein